MKGLLIDDDALFLRTLQRSLERRGIECLTAADGPAALTIARDQSLDFALVDLKIGNESGLRLIEPLRQAARRNAHRHHDRLRQRGHRGGSGQGGRA